MNFSQFQPINIISNPSVKRSSGLVQFTLKVFSLVTIENERAIILGPCDVTFPCPFGAENRQLFARVCARSIAPSVVLSMICAEVWCPGRCAAHARKTTCLCVRLLQAPPPHVCDVTCVCAMPVLFITHRFVLRAPSTTAIFNAI